MLEMDIERMEQMCEELHSVEYAWKKCVSELEDFRFQGENADDETLKEWKKILCNMQIHCRKLSKMIVIAEKAKEDYRIANVMTSNLIMSNEVCAAESTIGMNDLKEINQKMSPYLFHWTR